MSFSMKKISIPYSELEQHDFDAIVIGSGYGGAISAARLADAGQKVCLLERGREILPGDYPTDLTLAAKETQVTSSKYGLLTKSKKGEVPNGMLDIRINDDMNVVVGCGLGGTSLINANVSLETDPKTFWQKAEDGRYFWPSDYRIKKAGSDLPADPLAEQYETARQWLNAEPLPQSFNPNKLQALGVSATAISQPMDRPPINVTFKDGINNAGFPQAACTMCGDCCSGCNYGAKNTTLMNYLPYAHKRGAVIVTECPVKYISAPDKDGTWSVVVTDISKTGDPKKEHTLTATTVVLSAGTLGSTEILLRSKAKGLAMSDTIGQRFSGNGDVLGFGFDADWDAETRSMDEDRKPIWGIGAGSNYPLPPATPGENSATRPGPCITGVIKVDMAEADDVSQAAVIEEGVAPGPLSMIYPAVFFFEEALHGQMTRFPDTAERLKDAQALGTHLQSGSGFSELCYTGALSRTQSFLLMSHDSSGGEIKLAEDHDTVYVSWPGVGTEFPYVRDNDLLKACSDGIWANYLANPLWHENFGNKLITVHPVGGCVMAEDAAHGVVNADCHVFKGASGDAVYGGLLVCDGSVMPTSLGLNPLLTISAVTERAMSRLLGASYKCKLPAQAVSPKDSETTPDGAPPKKKTGESTWDEIAGTLSWTDAQLSDIIQDLVDDNTDGLGEKLNDLLKFYFGEGIAESNMKIILIALDTDDRRKDLEDACRQMQALNKNLLEVVWANPNDYDAVIALLEKQMGDFSPNMSFSETMAGWVGNVSAATGTISDPYDVDARAAKAAGQDLVADFTVSADSLDALLKSDTHPAQLTGTITWKGEDYDLSGTDAKKQENKTPATFNLLQQDTERVETWLMIYTGWMHPKKGGGDPVHFYGQKTLKRRPGSNWWTDLTTLYVKISTDKDGKDLVGRGVITLNLQDFLRQLQTIKSKIVSESDVTDLEAEIAEQIYYNTLNTWLQDEGNRNRIVRAALDYASGATANPVAADVAWAASRFYQMKFVNFFAMLIFRAYGGTLAYLNNFPLLDKEAGHVTPLPAPSGAPLRKLPKVISEQHRFPSAPGVTLQLVRFNGNTSGHTTKHPVILAPGFATPGLSYAMETVDTNLVDVLCAGGYDVWLLDYRGSPALGQTSLQPFTIDDIATQDWPAAVDYVQMITGADQVQAMVHCMGSMSFLMALLSGKLDHKKIRSAICSQLTVHPVTNWFNQMKADTKMAHWIRQGVPKQVAPVLDGLLGSDVAKLFEGLDTINANSVPGPGGAVSNTDQALNMMTWNVPFPYNETCYSPTCHRVFGIYGPVYEHSQLNQATHDALQTVFGEISTEPFEQIALMTRAGMAVDAQGRDVYMGNHDNLRLPLHFLAGALNLEFMPDTSLKTLNWLREVNASDAELYSRTIIQGYAHMDCFIGKNASQHIFPEILQRLNDPEMKSSDGKKG